MIYSSGSPHDEQSEHENEVDNNAITFQSGYDWRIGSFSEVRIYYVPIYELFHSLF